MADGMAQSLPLSRGMMEFFGEYRTALQETKAELKDLEKEAKRIEKSGGVVPDSLIERIGAEQGRRNRLEDRIAREKANKAGLRKAQQARGQLRRYFTDPVGTLTDFGAGRLERTAIGQRLQSMTNSAMSKIGNRLGQKTAIGLSGGTVLAGGAIVAGLTKVGFDIAIERQKLRERGVAGFGETLDVFMGAGKQAAFGGANAENLAMMQRNAIAEGADAKRAFNNASLWQKVKTLAYGDTTAGQDIDDKVMQSKTRRAIKASQYGAGYGDATTMHNIKRKRRQQYRAEMYSEMGYVNVAANRIGEWLTGSQNTEFVDATSGYLNVLTLGQIETQGLKSAEVKVAEKMKEMVSSKWEQQTKLYLDQYNDTSDVRYAMERADAHERTNAISAYNTDRLARGLTWSLQ